MYHRLLKYYEGGFPGLGRSNPVAGLGLQVRLHMLPSNGEAVLQEVHTRDGLPFLTLDFGDNLLMPEDVSKKMMMMTVDSM